MINSWAELGFVVDGGPEGDERASDVSLKLPFMFVVEKKGSLLAALLTCSLSYKSRACGFDSRLFRFAEGAVHHPADQIMH